MNELEKQVLETWGINHRTNLMLINAITEEALEMTTSKRGGGKIGYQLAHLYNVRYWKLETIDKTLIEGYTTVKSKDPKSKAMLTDLHETSALWIEQAFEAAIENGGHFKKGWKRGVVPLLGSMICHEAHHRGNILLTLKLCGFKLSNELKYGIWEWRKI